MFVPDLVTTYNLQLFSERNRPKKIERFVSSEKWSSKDRATALCLEYIVEEYTEYQEIPKKVGVVQCADYKRVRDMHVIVINMPLLKQGDPVYADNVFKGFALHGEQYGSQYRYMVGGASENGYPVTAPIRFGAKISNEKLYL